LASRALVAALLLEIADPDAKQKALLERYASQPAKNVRDLKLARWRPGGMWSKRR